jgi:hypothetical protein
MPRVSLLLAIFFWVMPVFAEGVYLPTQAAAEQAASNRELSSRQMEEDLQHMTWLQFRLVVEGVPKLKADIDAYGPTGWQYVQANYTTYRWRKSIKRLDETQKKRLIELIQITKAAR